MYPRRSAERSSIDNSMPSSGSTLPSDASGSGLGAVSQLERVNILKDQDEILERMEVSMGALKDMAGAITGELDEQATLLEETSIAVDVASGTMEAITNRVKKMIDATGGPKWCSVVMGLTAILVVLTYFAFF